MAGVVGQRFYHRYAIAARVVSGVWLRYNIVHSDSSESSQQRIRHEAGARRHRKPSRRRSHERKCPSESVLDAFGYLHAIDLHDGGHLCTSMQSMAVYGYFYVLGLQILRLDRQLFCVLPS